MTRIKSLEQLIEIYGEPSETAIVKVASEITDDYRQLIEASPFLTLATSGQNGLDCSPRGDRPGFVRIVDKHTLHIPDRRGNNRIDSLRNIVFNPDIALLFFLPGCGVTLRVSAESHISIDPTILNSFAVNESSPRSIIVARVKRIFFQCGRAILRSEIWNP
ncbi:MAG: MSMEG_1061 family FMN-dependent PPOX-type flavoprotein, partial [Planctomycetota bacterium]